MSNSKSFEGFEVFYNGLLMSLKMLKVIFLWTFIIYLIGGLVGSYLYLGHFAAKGTIIFYKAKILNSFASFSNKIFHLNWTNTDGTIAETTAGYIANNKEIADFAASNVLEVVFIYKCALFIFILLPIGLFYFKKKSEKQSEKKYIKGAKYLRKDDFLERLKETKDQTFLPFGSLVKTDIFGTVEKGEDDTPYQLEMPRKCETKHTSIFGRPGSGKTVLMSGLIAKLKSTENFKGIIYCYKGDYVGRFYNPETDLLFNPLDNRSMNWPIFNEIKTRVDIEMVAGSLIPIMASDDEKDQFFKGGAKNVFTGLLLYLFNNGLTSNKDIWEHVSKTDEDIVNLLKITPGAEKALKSIGALNSGQASGVFGTFSKHTSCFEFMQHMEGNFSIQDWLDNGTGFIFLSNYENMKEILKPVLSLFIDLLGRRLLSMPDDDDRSIYFKLDEVHTLQKLGSIVDILTLIRSKGGKIFLGTQSYAQLDQIYGNKVRDSMVNSCGNSVVMALSGDKQQKIAAETFTKVEFYESNKTSSMGVSDFKDGMSIATQRKKEPLVMESDIKFLPELTCLAGFANFDGIVRSELTYVEYEEINIAFDMRPDLILESQENLPAPPKKKKKKKGSNNSGPRFLSLEEEVKQIDYDAIAAQVNHNEITEQMIPDEMAEQVNHDEMNAQMASDEMAEQVNNDEMIAQMSHDEMNV